jgi:hypothetical protein
MMSEIPATGFNIAGVTVAAGAAGGTAAADGSSFGATFSWHPIRRVVNAAASIAAAVKDFRINCPSRISMGSGQATLHTLM